MPNANAPTTPAARRGLMMVLSSPSGAGKTTLCREILRDDKNLSVSVSVTTRTPRPGETDGVDYHFRSIPAFEALRDGDGLLEWATVHGNFYGTPRADVMQRLAQGQDLLFDLDWQGAQKMAEQAPADTVRVFVLPPSAAALEQRLIGRRQDNADVIARRIAGAPVEIAHWAEYDYVIVNEDLGQSLSTLRTVLAAERLRRSRQTRLPSLVQQLISDLKTRAATR